MKANIYLVFLKYIKALAFSIVFLVCSTTVFADEDLKISIYGPNAADPGETLNYTVLFYNAGTTPASNVVIEVALPNSDLYTFSSADANVTVIGDKLTWDKNSVNYLESLGAGAHTLTFSLVAGENNGNGSGGYYMPNIGSNTLDFVAAISSDATTSAVTTPVKYTEIEETIGVTLVDNLQVVIKSATGTSVIYQLQVTNDGNVYDKFDLAAVNGACPGESFDPLDHRFLDIYGN